VSSLHENCNTCGQDYEITSDTACLNLFIADPACNHIEAHCSCGATEVIYVGADAFLHVMQTCKLGVSLYPRASEELQARAAATWSSRSEPTAPAWVELPTHDLTDRQEQDISGFAASFAAIPDELFWTFIEDDTNHDRPETWT
jgi:hypothetical protein